MENGPGCERIEFGDSGTVATCFPRATAKCGFACSTFLNCMTNVIEIKWHSSSALNLPGANAGDLW